MALQYRQLYRERKCHHLCYINQGRLAQSQLYVRYQGGHLITTLSSPRHYLIETEDFHNIYLTVGDNSPPSQAKNSFRAEWVIKGKDHEIMLYLDLGQSPSFTNLTLGSEVGLLLEAIAYSEIPLLSHQKQLGQTKISVSFRAEDKQYCRIEPWNSLESWLPDTFRLSKPKRHSWWG